MTSSAALASSHFQGRRTLPLRGCLGVSARKRRRQEVDASDTPCGSQAVRRFSRSASGNAAVFLFGRSVPNHQLSGPAPAGFARLRGPLN